MKIKYLSAVAALASLVALAVPAQAETLLCDMAKAPKGHWVGSKIFVFVEANAKTAKVMSPVLHHFKQSPKTANVRKNTGNNLSLNWVLKDSRDSKNSHAVRMEYRFNLNRKTGVVNVRATPQGYYNDFYRRGTCAPFKKK